MFSSALLVMQYCATKLQVKLLKYRTLASTGPLHEIVCVCVCSYVVYYIIRNDVRNINNQRGHTCILKSLGSLLSSIKTFSYNFKKLFISIEFNVLILYGL